MSQRVTISLPDDLAELLAREARRRGDTVSGFVREALEVYLRSPTSEVREVPFVALGRSGTRSTARDAESILEREWARAGRR
jgi:metal-responsive CopG/Arc/MetJ family transcriptional regulator